MSRAYTDFDDFDEALRSTGVQERMASDASGPARAERLRTEARRLDQSSVRGNRLARRPSRMSGHELTAYDDAAVAVADEDGGFGVDWLALAKLAAVLFVLVLAWRWRG